LHLGHARTFLIAAERAHQAGGTLILRNEDLDPQRCRPEYAQAIWEDLKWLGISWAEGPDCDGPFGPYSQSLRKEFYLEAWRELRDGGLIFPCTCSRKELASAPTAPNDADDEPIYPGKCRGRRDAREFNSPAGVNWRFRVPDGEEVRFADENLGAQSFISGRDFGDFAIWRRDDVPAYQFAVVVDDHAMHITEAVRAVDLLKSTARQLLLYRALGIPPIQFYHCDLVRDDGGARLAKRHNALAIRTLRQSGWTAEQVRTRAFTAI
jgi:glutamyl-tRNA synthetase